MKVWPVQEHRSTGKKYREDRRLEKQKGTLGRALYAVDLDFIL